MPEATLIDKFKLSGLDAPVEREQISVDPAEDALAKRKYDDEAALQILKQDLEYAEGDKLKLEYNQMWTANDELLQSPWRNNYYFNPARANVPRYTLSNIIDVVVTKIMGGLFFEETPFMLLANPKLDQKIMWAKEAVASTQLREMEFSNECEKGWFQCAHQGVQFYKYGWMDHSKKVPVYKAKGDKPKFSTPLGDKELDTPESDDFEMTWESKDIHRPWLKWRDMRCIAVAPTWNEGDVRKTPWLCDSEYITLDEIDIKRDDPDYDIPSKEDLESLFFPPNDQQSPPGDITETRPTNMRAWLVHSEGREVNDSADPYARKIRYVERWDKYKVTGALQNNKGYLLILNKPHDYGAVPYLSSTWRPLPSSGYGQGLGQLIGPDQQIEKGTLCAYLDILSFIARPSYIRQKTLNTPSQDIKIDLGSIISVEGPVNEAWKMLEQPKVDASLVAAIDAAKNSAANTSGANELVGQGNTVGAGRGTGMRSGTGSQLVGQAQAGRLDGPLERFIRQVFVPWLYIMDEMNAKRLPARSLREILEGDQEHDYTNFNHITWRNAKVEYQILAGAHLGPRKQMAEFMPFLQQLVNTPPMMQAAQQAGLIFDFDVFINSWSRLAGFPQQQSFFRKMTDDEKQKAEANSPAAVQQMKGQQAQQQLAQKGEQDENKIAAQSQGRAAEKVTQLMLEKTMMPEGEHPTIGAGFGG